MITKEELRTIRRVGRNVRRKAERRVSNLDGLYHNLTGLCDVVSRTLVDALNREGIRAEMSGNDHHAYVMFKDYVIDLTATQFGIGTKVVVQPYDNLKHEDFWKRNRRSKWFKNGTESIEDI